MTTTTTTTTTRRRAVAAWVCDAAHVPALWWVLAPYGILAAGCGAITVADALTR